ncbi:MAG TPA: hypothetical protein VD884_10975 [Ohtaekwangia sp.]|nr:hypothetical protein [Ohtaekwangia sp.]
MISLHQKHQIMETLNAMDAEQTEKVLNYMKGMVNATDEKAHQQFKTRALKQIRRALVRNAVNPSF